MKPSKKRALVEDTTNFVNGMIAVRVSVNAKVGKLHDRFNGAVKSVLEHIVERSASYWLEPVLIAQGVTTSALESIPRHAGDVYVRLIIRNHALLITSLSTGTPHSFGARSIMTMTDRWNSSNYFDVLSRTTINFGAELCAAPDTVVSVPKQLAPPGSNRHNLVVAELEVSDRSLAQMRRDFLPYFADPALQAVIGIKFCGPASCPIVTGLAVQWTRTTTGIVVSAIRDFGLEAIPDSMASGFAQDLEGALPGVPVTEWAANRHVPIVPAMIDPPSADSVVTPEMAKGFLRGHFDESALYQASTAPLLVVPAAELMATLHGLPPDAAPQKDLVLSLANVLYWVARGTAYC